MLGLGIIVLRGVSNFPVCRKPTLVGFFEAFIFLDIRYRPIFFVNTNSFRFMRTDMDTAELPDMCLQQGYQCKCSQCQIWIDRWNKELEAFSIIDSMTHNGKNLFQIYERLRAAHPDILRVHHAHIEKEYVKSKYSLE